nr:MAG TPA: hypothetical protein [Caudoviricetes sp.]
MFYSFFILATNPIPIVFHTIDIYIFILLLLFIVTR